MYCSIKFIAIFLHEFGCSVSVWHPHFPWNRTQILPHSTSEIYIFVRYLDVRCQLFLNFIFLFFLAVPLMMRVLCFRREFGRSVPPRATDRMPRKSAGEHAAHHGCKPSQLYGRAAHLGYIVFSLTLHKHLCSNLIFHRHIEPTPPDQLNSDAVGVGGA